MRIKIVTVSGTEFEIEDTGESTPSNYPIINHDNTVDRTLTLVKGLIEEIKKLENENE